MGRGSQEPQARADHREPPGEAMKSIRTAAIGLVVAATALLGSGPALAQQKRAAAAPPVVANEPAAKQDQADLERSQIIGNRELPKVLYIVPWKKPGPRSE